MPSKGFTVDTTNRNDVVSFYQAVFKASEGYETRPMWKDHAIPGYYASDHSNVTAPYTYSGFDTTNPITKAPDGRRAAGVLHQNFVKDVERRVNFYRALAGVPANVSLADSDTARNTSTIQPTTGIATTYEPALTATKADAAQESAYLISRTYVDRYSTGYRGWGSIHEQTAQVIPELRAWSREAWNSHRHSNLSRGYYGPRAIDEYLSEDQPGTASNGSPKENLDVGHRRKVLQIRATNFATGDTPPSYVVGNTPEIRDATNALYYVQRPGEYSDAPARFVAYPSSGFFPAPFNSPYWSLTYPGAVGTFTGATVTMTDSGGNPVTVSNLTQSTTLTDSVHERTLSWKVEDTNATATSITTDRTYHVTVSGIDTAGAPASYSYSVTLINPDIITSPQTITGSNTPPANGSAAYLVTPPGSSEAIQVNSFQASTTAWEETGAAPLKIKDLTHANYSLYAKPNDFVAPSVNVIATATTLVFRLSHAVRYDPMAEGLPEEIFELDREILPNSGATATLKFNYQRGYMTDASTLAVEISDNEGATWSALGTEISGHISSASGSGSPQTTSPAPTWTANLPASTVPLRVRFRFYKSKVGSSFLTYNHSDSGWSNRATGIFINKISTTNTRWMDLKKTNEVAATTTKFTLDNTSAGMTLTNGSPLHLRTRAKLGGNWMQYGPLKTVTPTSSPATGFAGWTAYDYPELTGGFGGDHDGDGSANAVEFAFYQNPTQTNASVDTITRSADTISIERSIPSQRAGLTYKAEWSDTLAAGSWSQANVVVTFPSGKVLATAPAGTGKRFIRWKFDE